MALRRKDQTVARFFACVKKPWPAIRLFMHSAILNSFFYAYRAIVDSFVIVCFYVEKYYIP